MSVRIQIVNILAVASIALVAHAGSANAGCYYPCVQIDDGYDYDDDDYRDDYYTYGYVTDPEYGVEVEQEIYAAPESYTYYGPGDDYYFDEPRSRGRLPKPYIDKRVVREQVAGYRRYRYEPWTDEWFAYCQSRFRSFDPATGTYQPYHGPRRLCR